MALTNASKDVTGPKVIIGREVARLSCVPVRYSAAEAAAAGILVRRKVEGIWLYASDGRYIDEAASDVLRAACLLCRDWLLGSMRILAGKIAKDSGSVTMEAIRPLIRAHVRSGSLRALPALTTDYEPYLSVYDPEDESEIAGLLAAARSILTDVGTFDSTMFGEPLTPRTSRAWQYALLAHLEWLGLGSADGGAIAAWRQP
jgi:hypothetical protein